MKKKQKVQIFKLEERVLFDGAAAAEIVAAVNNAGNAHDADQNSDDSEQGKEEKFVQNTVQNAGPVDTPAADANVQNAGEGLPQADAAQNDPAEVLIQGHADFSQVTDPGAEFSGDVAEFIQAASDPDADASAHELIVIDSDAADQFDADDFEGKNVLVLDGDSDADDQIEDWMNEHSGQDIESVRLITDSDTLAAQISDLDVEVVSVEAFQGELSSFEAENLVVMPDSEANITVEAESADVLPDELADDAAADRHELVIVNSNMTDLDNVLEQLGDSRDVLVIDSTGDAFEQISAYLDNSDTAYDAVHILTHGNDEGFYLGSQKVIAADPMTVFDGHMAEHGDFLLYGCNLAANDHGQALIHNIADLTGCDVAASVNITGAEALGGDWTLEYTSGAIETAAISLDSSWDHRLAAKTITVDSTVAEEEGKSYKTFSKALSNAEDGDTIEIKTVNEDDDGPTTVISLNKSLTIGYATDSTTTFNWNINALTINSGKTLTISGITLSGGRGGNVTIQNGASLILTNKTNDVHVNLMTGGTLEIGSATTVSNVDARDNSTIAFDASGSTVTNLTLESGATPWTFTTGTVGTLDNYHSAVTANGVALTNVNNLDNGVFTLSKGTVSGILNHTEDAEALTIQGTSSVATLISETEPADVNVLITGNAKITTANLKYGTYTISGGTIGTLNATSATLIDLSGSTSVTTALNSTSTDVTVNITGTIATLNHNSGNLTLTKGNVTILNNHSTGTNVINGATVYGLTNTGSISYIAGAVTTVDNNAGTISFDGGNVSGFVTNAEGATLAFNADTSTGQIINSGTLDLNGITLSIATDSTSKAIINRGTGIINFNTATLLNTDPSAPVGIGLSNTAGGTVNATAATATISGFTFGSEQASTNIFDFTSTGNTIKTLSSVTVRGNNGAVPGVVSMDDALAQIVADAASFYSINIQLLLSEYSDWSNFLTVNGAYAGTIDNLRGIASNTVVNDVYITQNVILNSSLTLAPSDPDKTVLLNDVSLTINDGSTLTIAGNTTLALNGTSQQIASVAGLDTPYPTATLKAGASTLTNNGTLTVTGNVVGEYDNLTGKLQSIVNNGTFNLTGNYNLKALSVALSSITSGIKPEVDLIYNTGTFTVAAGSFITADSSSVADSVSIPVNVTTAALLRNTGTAEITGSTLSLESNSGNRAYAVYNDGKLTITDSFVAASGSSTYGLFNGVNGDATFKVTQLPNIILSKFSGSDGTVTVNEYANQVYHIKGTTYSVYNQGKFTTVNGITDPAVTNGLLTGTVGSVSFRDAPVYALIGNFQTMAVAGGTVSTALNDITLVGWFDSFGAAKNNLTNLVLNGNLYNTASEVYVAGAFMPSDFTVGNNTSTYKGYYGYGGSYSAITIINNESTTEGSRKGGAIYFGQKASSLVAFNSNLDYIFYNLSGEMYFDYFAGLSSEAHPAQFYNRGVMTIDGTHADGKIDGFYRLYVKQVPAYVGALFNYAVADGISDGGDAGIVNFYANPHDVASVIPNQLTLTNLDIRNTQNASTAVTNYGGNLAINYGKLSATYSGLDNMEVHEIVISSSKYDFYVITGIASLNGLTEIAGAAYSVRNNGELTLTGPGNGNYTLFTNQLDFSTNYTGGYTSVLNSAVSVGLWERNTTVDNVAYNTAHYIWNSAFSSDSLTLPRQKGSSLLASSHLYHMTPASTVVQTEVTFTLAGSYSSSDPAYTDNYYNPVPVFIGKSDLNHVSFLAKSTPATNVALSNWGNLTVKDVDAVNQFNGFKFMLDVSNSYYATYKTSGSTTLKPVSVTSHSDIEVGFEIAASTVKSTALSWDLTLRGVKVEDSDYEYKGNFDVNGSALSVSSYGELTLVNFSVYAHNAANAIQVDGGGLLHIFNGIYDDATHQWVGGSNAVISSDGNANGVMLYGTMEMINGAITECVNGIVAADTANVLLVVNSTIAGNSGWGIVANYKAPSESNKHNLFVANSTIAYNGLGGIQVNNGGKLSMLNSIVLNSNTAGTGSVDIVLNNGSTMAPDFEGNVYGSSASDTNAKLKDVFDSLSLNWTGPDMYTISQVKDNQYAWNASIQWSYNVSSDTHLFLSEIVIGSGGTYSITYDKMGNAREASGFRIGSYVLSGSVGPTAILVNTLQDSEDILPGKLYSLRYVINYLLSSENTGGDTVVAFDWEKLIAEDPTLNISLGTTLGSLAVVHSDDTPITELTIDLTATGYEIPSGYTLNINGSALTKSVFTVSGIALTINGGGALTFTGATTAADGAVFNLADVSGTSLTLTDATVTGGTAGGNGGAVYVGGANAALTVTGTTFSSNSAANGGAIYNNGGTLSVSGTFTGNSATGNGGAIYSNGGPLSVSGTFTGNSASGNGGAIYNDGPLSVSVSGTFTGNSASGNGGAIYSDGGTLSVSGTLTGNTALDGGAIYNAAGTVAVNNGTLSENTAYQNGGALYNAAGAAMTVTGNLSKNIAGENGGAIYNAADLTVSGMLSENSAAEKGGALYNAGIAELTYNGDVVTGNEATDGAGIYHTGSRLTVTGNLSNNIAGGKGGALYNAGTAVSISGNITANEAAQGAGIYSKSGTVVLTGNLENNNTAAGEGAGIYMEDGEFSLIGNITGNTGGSIVYADAGLVQLGDLDHYLSIRGNNGNLVTQNGGDILIVNATIEENNAGTGSLFAMTDGVFTLLNSTVTGNTGDILNQTAGTVQFADSTIAFNAAGAQITAAGKFYVVNSIVNAANDFTPSVTYQAGSLLNEDVNAVFSIQGGEPQRGPNGTLIIRMAGPAGANGVLAGYTHDPTGTAVYYTQDGEQWYDVTGAAVTVSGITSVEKSQNGTDRLYQGFSLLSIGAYSMGSDTLSLEVTISGDVPRVGETTLREALEYAEFLYNLHGEAQTVTFRVNNVYLNSSITVGTPAIISGSGVTISAVSQGPSSLFSGDSVFILNGTAAVEFNSLTVKGMPGVRGIRVDAGTATLQNVTIVNGQADGSVPGSEARGGAVYVKSGATLSGGGVTLRDNYADDGGAIYSNGSVNLNSFTVSGNYTSNANSGIITLTDASSMLSLRNGSFTGNVAAGQLVKAAGDAVLLSVAAADNTLGSSLLSAKSADVVNSTLTGDPADGSALLVITGDLNAANSIMVTTSASGQAVQAGSISSAYSIYSGTLGNVAEDVENQVGLGYNQLFTGELNNGQPVIQEDSPAAVGVWTTYDPATRQIAYSERPEDICTVSYKPENMNWRYLGGGAASYNSSLLVGSASEMPSIGVYWLNTGRNHPDFGPGVNNTFINPSFNGGFGFDWGYNAVVNGYYLNPSFGLTDASESGMGWYSALLSELFGVRSPRSHQVLSVGGGIPWEELDLSVNAMSEDFEEFQETPYHADDGTPLSQEELEAIQRAAVTGRIPAESVHLDETIHGQVAASLRSAELFKDSFDKALDALLRLDA